MMEDVHHIVERQTKRGCPQGSILGPKFWNLIMEELPNTQPIAYAGDLVILIPGNSRRALEERGAAAMAILGNWASSNKLTVSERKTVGMLLKGALHHRRPTAIPTAGGNLIFRERVRYLGVILQRGLKMDDHVTETAKKAKRLFHALARLGGQGWGYQAVNYIVLYKVFFQSICAYAAHGWARIIRKRHQRQALIGRTKAYATASTDCLPVIAGCSLLTCTYRGRYTDTGSVEDYQLCHRRFNHLSGRL